MGFGRMSASAWDDFTASTTAGKSTAHVFTARGMKDNLNPSMFEFRESCDSVDNPNSTAIGIFLDVTGSMGMIPDYMAREGMKPLFTEIYDRKPVSDPHIMFGAIGDVRCDRSPLQVSQFEANIVLAEQLVDFYLEGGGGGNSWESYNLPWFLAATRTKIDCMIKRKKKGYLFTIGDEETPDNLTVSDLQRVFGPGQYTALTNEQLLEMVRQSYHVFHVVVEEGSHCRGSNADRVVAGWHKLLGQNVLRLSNYKKLAEVIVSAIQITEGESHNVVVDSWDKTTALVVARATNGLMATNKTDSALVSF